MARSEQWAATLLHSYRLRKRHLSVRGRHPHLYFHRLLMPNQTTLPDWRSHFDSSLFLYIIYIICIRRKHCSSRCHTRTYTSPCRCPKRKVHHYSNNDEPFHSIRLRVLANKARLVRRVPAASPIILFILRSLPLLLTCGQPSLEPPDSLKAGLPIRGQS